VDDRPGTDAEHRPQTRPPPLGDTPANNIQRVLPRCDIQENATQKEQRIVLCAEQPKECS
jgi:hypothetical protein